MVIIPKEKVNDQYHEIFQFDVFYCGCGFFPGMPAG